MESDYEHLKLREIDFKRAINGMGYSSFRIDLNFAYLVYYQLLNPQPEQPIVALDTESCPNPENLKRKIHDQMKLLNAVQDTTFEKVLTRNFNRCPVNPNFFIYCDNS